MKGWQPDLNKLIEGRTFLSSCLINIIYLLLYLSVYYSIWGITILKNTPWEVIWHSRSHLCCLVSSVMPNPRITKLMSFLELISAFLIFSFPRYFSKSVKLFCSIKSAWESTITRIILSRFIFSKIIFLAFLWAFCIALKRL